jgi:hypothetical protein
MGIRYVSYRIFYELKRKTGILKRKFPIHPQPIHCLNLAEWRTSAQPFFFSSRETISMGKKPNNTLKEAFNNILSGKIPFFSYQYFDLGNDYDWVTNPDSGFRYDIRKHWTEINDYNKEAGDINMYGKDPDFLFYIRLSVTIIILEKIIHCLYFNK